MIKDLVLKNRSYRRFYNDHKISKDELVELVDLARLSASGRNLQPLKYFLSADNSTNDKVFECLAWAGYLKDWDGPEKEEQPTAHIVICGDKSITENYMVDHGIASQSILLGAVEKGLGGCIFGSINRKKLVENINLPENLEVLLVIALGKPKEEIVIDEAKEGDIKYWRDEQKVHHVPKRSIDEILL